MIHTLRSLKPVPEIYVLVPPPLYDPYPFEMNATIINTIYPSLIRNIAEVTQTKVIDVYSAFMNAPYQNLTCDGCHPKEYGNFLIANSIYNAIKK
jgi:alpha-L-fucosidase 2